MEVALSIIGVLIAIALVTFVARGLRVVQQYERGVVFRLGRIHREPLEPGLNLVHPIIDRVV
jgi:regulator of protease activity HflC (stomatin/prohibitin superfamily)